MKCLVTHGDLDGLAAAAVIYNVLMRDGCTPQVYISQPFNLYQVLEKLSARNDLEMLIIIDVSIDEATWVRAKNALERIVSSGTRVLWIDHHKTTIAHAFELANMGISVIFTTHGSASTIAREVFVNYTDDPEFFKKVSIMGEVGDKVRSIEPGTPLAAAIEAVGSALVAEGGNDEFRKYVLKLWVYEKKLVDDEVAIRAEKAVARLAELISEAKNRFVYESDRIVIIDMRNLKVRGFVGKVASHYANKMDKVVFVIFQLVPHEVVITCRVPPNIQFNASDSLFRIARSLGGGGGGHEKAASIRVPSHLIEKAVEMLIGLEREIEAGCRKG